MLINIPIIVWMVALFSSIFGIETHILYIFYLLKKLFRCNIDINIHIDKKNSNIQYA